MVPIGAGAAFKSTSEPYRLPRYNLFPAAEVMGAAAPGRSSGGALGRMEQLADQVLPNGISYEWTDLAHQEKTQTTSPLTVFLARSEEHTSELQSLMRISYAVFCLKNKIQRSP